ncbi:MAG: recombinase family protein [Deltaproteobacteria bacterium]|nr:recombinase family protein [Deltaproteobacteria bacterium]
MTQKKIESNNTTRCAIYTRKATTDDSCDECNSLQVQRERCEAFVKSRTSEGWVINSVYYDDDGVSSSSNECPSFQRMLDDIYAGRVDYVIVSSLCRLTRSLTSLVDIIEFFDMHEVGFVAVVQQFDTKDDLGREALNSIKGHVKVVNATRSMERGPEWLPYTQ